MATKTQKGGGGGGGSGGRRNFEQGATTAKRNTPNRWGSGSPSFSISNLSTSSNGPSSPGITNGQQQQHSGPAQPTMGEMRHMHDRLVFIITALIGHRVTVTVKGGLLFSGLLSNALTESELQIGLRRARELDPSTGQPRPDVPVKPAFIIKAKDLLEIQADDVDLSGTAATASQAQQQQQQGSGKGFRTDTEISGAALAGKERELQAWGAGAVAAGEDGGIGGSSLEDDEDGTGPQANGTGNAGANLDFNALLAEQAGRKSTPWDQFAVNEKLFGTTTDYKEEFYTTTLIKTGPGYKEKERAAERLAKEIESGLVTNAHIAEERGIDGDDMDEEAKYGAVIRGPMAYVPPGARKGGPKTGMVRPPVAQQGAAATGAPGTVTAPPTPGGPQSNVLPGSSSNGNLARTAIEANAAKLGPPIAAPPLTRVHSSGGVDGGTVIPSGLPSAVLRQVAVDGVRAPGTPDGAGSSLPDAATAARQFLDQEKQKAIQKKQHLLKREKEHKIAELKKFGAGFTLNTPLPKELLPVLAKDEKKQAEILAKQESAAAAAATSKQRVPTSAAALERTISSAMPSSSANPIHATPITRVPPRFIEKIGPGHPHYIPPIPPFNAAKAKQKAGAGDDAAATPTSTAPTTGIPASASTSKISAAAPAFKPNANAAPFTPGGRNSGPPAPRKGSEATITPQQPTPSTPINPFFGAKVPKKGSSIMHVKEDFTPFKNQNVADPASVDPKWGFTGKPYRQQFGPNLPPQMLAPPASATSGEEEGAQSISQASSPGPMHPQAMPYGVYPAYSPYAFPGQLHPHQQHMHHPGMAQRPGLPGFQPPPHFVQVPFSPGPVAHGGPPGAIYSPQIAGMQPPHSQAFMTPAMYPVQGGRGPPPPLAHVNGAPQGPMFPYQMPMPFPNDGRPMAMSASGPGHQQFET